MTKVLLTFCFIYSLSVFGQTSLTINNFPKAGYSIKIAAPKSISIDLNKIGENIIWDLSELTPDTFLIALKTPISEGGMVINFQFGFFAPEKYQADYIENFDALPIAAIKQQLGDFSSLFPVKIEAINRLVKKYDDKITYPGYSLKVNGQQIGFRSDIIETGYQLPLTYGDHYTSNSITDFDFSIIYDAQIKQYRKRETKVDAYGTLIVPYTASYEVIRIHHHITELDSLRINIFGINQWFSIPRTMDVYEWWSPKLKRPILKVDNETVLGNSFQKKVTFYLTPVPPGTQLFPNPAISWIKVQSDENIGQLIIFDMQGKAIKTYDYIGPEMKINISTIPSGRYTVQTISKKGIKYYPLIIQ